MTLGINGIACCVMLCLLSSDADVAVAALVDTAALGVGVDAAIVMKLSLFDFEEPTMRYFQRFVYLFRYRQLTTLRPGEQKLKNHQIQGFS